MGSCRTPPDDDGSKVKRMAHVLIIGHDSARRAAAEARCRAEGHTVAVARHGTEAMVYLSRLKVDSVMVDPRMPGREAAAFIQALRQHPAYAALPVHGLTSESEPEPALSL
ncbi:Gliding motility regulatory protein [compost metagenome]